jgi:hypothetical protein
MAPTRTPRRRRPSRRKKQFNVPIDAATDGEVSGVCLLLRCKRPQMFHAALDALLGRRAPLSAAERQLLEAIMRAWQEAARRKPRGAPDT